MKICSVFIRNGLILTLFNVVIKIFVTVFSIFLSNTIPSNIIGCWHIIMSFFALLITISTSGINLSATILVSRERSFGNPENIPCIMRQCIYYIMVFSSISIIFMFIFKDFLLRSVNLSSSLLKYIYPLCISIPLCAITSCINGYFIATQKLKLIMTSHGIETISQILITYIFYNISHFSEVSNTLFALVTSMLISDFIAFLYSLKKYLEEHKILSSNLKCNRTLKKNILKLSIPVAITSYIKSILSTIKNTTIPIALVLFGYEQKKALSYYGLISSTLMTLILFPFTFIQSYNNLLVPEISSKNIKKNKPIIQSIAKKSIFFTLMYSFFITIIFVLLSKTISNLFYKSVDIHYYLRVLSPIIILIYVDNIIDNILKSIGSQFYVIIINIFDLILTISLIKIFIPIYGITAYIALLYVSELFNILLSALILNKKLFR